MATKHISQYKVLAAFEVDKTLFLKDDIIYLSDEYRYNGRPIYIRNAYNSDRKYVGLLQREVGQQIDNLIELIKTN